MIHSRTARVTARSAVWLPALLLCAPLLLLAISWQTPSDVWPHLRAHVLGPATRDTLALAALVGLGVSVLGLGLAWLSARCDYPGRRWLDWALVLPLAMPGYVAAFAYVGLLDYAGPVQSAWRALSGSRAALPEVRGVVGAAVILSLVLYPYVYLLARAAFLRQGAAAFDAARALGHGPAAAFLRVALPLARPAWLAGLTLALLETLADFGAVSILGVDTFTTAIYKTWFALYSLPGAAQLSSLLLLAVALVLVLEAALRPLRRDERSLRPMPRIELRGARAVAASTAALTVFGLGFGLPLLRLLDWAARADTTPAALAPALGHTLLLGVIAALAVTVLGLGFALLRRRHPQDRWLRVPVFAATLGYAVPGTVLAVACMLTLLGLEAWLRDRLGWTIALSSSVVALLFALCLRFLRIGYASVDAGLRQLRPEYLEVARSLGAGAWTRLQRITLPLLRPSVQAALLLAAVEVMKEMPATLMLRPFGWDTLAVKIYAYTSEGLWHEAAWPALLLVALGLWPVWWLVRSSEE